MQWTIVRPKQINIEKNSNERRKEDEKQTQIYQKTVHWQRKIDSGKSDGGSVDV